MTGFDSFVLGLVIGEDEASARKEKQTDSPWHTGTPTEEGWYLCKLKDTDLYETTYFHGYDWSEYIEKWQKIEDEDSK